VRKDLFHHLTLVNKTDSAHFSPTFCDDRSYGKHQMIIGERPFIRLLLRPAVLDFWSFVTLNQHPVMSW